LLGYGLKGRRTAIGPRSSRKPSARRGLLAKLIRRFGTGGLLHQAARSDAWDRLASDMRAA